MDVSSRNQLILLKNLTIQQNDTTVLHNIDLNIGTAEKIVILGGHGSGKSTLMSALMGTTPPTSGKILIKGQDIFADYAALKEWRAMTGIMGRKSSLILDASVWENLWLLSERMDEMEGKRILSSLGLHEFIHRPAGSLSGGQKRRLLLARALVSGATHLMLDEPSAGLDPITTRSALQLVTSMVRGTLIIFTSDGSFLMDPHGTSWLDRLILLEHGVISYDGPFDHTLVREMSPHDKEDVNI